MGILSAIFKTEEVDDTQKVDPSKPLKQQIGDSNRPFTVVPPMPAPLGAQPYQNPIGISDEDKAKYEKYFQNLFNQQNDPKPSYHEFIAMIESFGNAVADGIKYPAAMAGFKIQGLTKDTLLNTAQGTLKAIQNDATEFSNALKQKADAEIESKKKLIQQKSEEILKLQSEIQQLSGEVQAAEQKLNTSAMAYNTYSQRIQSKIQTDIQAISSYIQ